MWPLRQRSRLILLVFYVGLLFLLSRISLGDWIPPFDEHGLWFYAGLYAFLVGALLEAPTHTTPAQAFTFAALAGIGVAGFGIGNYPQLDALAKGTYFLALLAEIVVVGAAVVAIIWKDRPDPDVRSRLGSSGYVIASALGRPQFISFWPFLFAVISFHRANPTRRIGFESRLGCAGDGPVP